MESSNQNNTNLSKDYDHFQKPGFLAKCVNYFSKVFNLKSFILSNFIFKPPKEINYKFENIDNKLYFYLKKNNENEGKEFNEVEVPNGYQLFPFILSYKVSKESYQIPLLYLIKNSCENNSLIIYSHGNASDLSDVYYLMLAISKFFNVDVIAYDYSGYGISHRNQISESSTFDDLMCVLSFSVQKLKYQLNDIILWGFSLGGGPTVEIASRFQNLGGIILQAPLASMNVWIDKNAQWNYDFINGDIYCNINKIDHINTKILILHGKNDKIINDRHSKLLYERYVKSSRPYKDIRMFLLNNIGHNDMYEILFNYDEKIYDEIYNFIGNTTDSEENNSSYEARQSIWNEDYRMKQRLLYLEKELKCINVWSSHMDIIGEFKNMFQETLMMIFSCDSNGKLKRK